MFDGLMKAAKSAVTDVKHTVSDTKRSMMGKPPKNRGRSGGACDAQGHPITEAQFATETAKVIKGDVRMFSGCMDEQTSADVSNVASFGLPAVSGAESAGGACTNALLSTVAKNPHMTYGDLLVEMQRTLKQRKYTQVPQLSSSRKVDLKLDRFSVMNPNPNGRTRAVLIGINYFGQKGELAGCVNDVRMMKNFVVQSGFSDRPEHMQILTDDPTFHTALPTAENIIKALQWLVRDAQPGDSLFLHYSGHGGQLPDDDGDEADGYDETLIPVDYQKAGQIRDDTIFKLVVAPLPEGTRLLCVFDCCHSGTILDLPFEFSATDGNVAALSEGHAAMHPNNDFNLATVIALISDVARGLFDSFDEVSRTVAFNGKSVQRALGIK
jgi:hypothetical protein